MQFPRQECRGGGGLPFPPAGDRPHPGIKVVSLSPPGLAGGLFTTEPPKFGAGEGWTCKPFFCKTEHAGPPVLALGPWSWIPKSVCHPLTTFQSSLLLPSATYSEFMGWTMQNWKKRIPDTEYFKREWLS